MLVQNLDKALLCAPWRHENAPSNVLIEVLDGTYVIANTVENTAQPYETYPSGTYQFDGDHFIIDPVVGGECILNTSQVVAPGAKITVVAGKKFRVVSNMLIRQ